MLVREGNKIIVKNRVRSDELFGGRIGKVNARSKDAPKVVEALRGLFSKSEMDLEIDPNGFLIYGSYTNRKNKSSFHFTIGEKAKDKICIDLERVDKGKRYVIDQVKGLILDPKKIRDALAKLMEDNGYDPKKDRLDATSKVRAAEWEAERKMKEREAAIQRERDLKEFQRKEKEWAAKHKMNDKEVTSSKDWVEVSPRPQTWILDPGRL